MNDKVIGKLSDDKSMSCSRLAALIGVSPFSSPNDELKNSISALGEEFAPSELPPDRPMPEVVEIGTEFENNILRLGAKRLGLYINTNITERVSSSKINLQGSLDGILEGNDQIIKTDHSKGIIVYGDNDEIRLSGPGVAEAKFTTALPSPEPMPFRGPIQCQGLQMCTGYKWHVIFTLYGRTGNLVCYIGQQDKSLEYKITQEVNRFERKLDIYKKEGSIDYYNPINTNDAARTYANAENELPPIVLSDEGSLAANQILLLKKDVKCKTETIDKLQTYLMSEMGIHTSAVSADNNLRITWPVNKARDGYVIEARPAARSKTLRLKLIDGGKK